MAVRDTSKIGDDCLQELGCFDKTAGRPGLKHLTLDVKFRLINLVLGKRRNVWKTVMMAASVNAVPTVFATCFFFKNRKVLGN